MHYLSLSSGVRLLLLDAEGASHLSHQVHVLRLPVDSVTGGCSNAVRRYVLAQVFEDVVGAADLCQLPLLILHFVCFVEHGAQVNRLGVVLVKLRFKSRALSFQRIQLNHLIALNRCGSHA